MMKAANTLIMMLAAASGCARNDIPSFPELDRNGDGRISRQEAAEDSRLGEIFTEVDADGDGELSALEYLRAHGS